MANEKEKQVTDQNATASVDTRKAGWFDYLNQPITISFGRRSDANVPVQTDSDNRATEAPLPAQADFFSRLKHGLSKTQQGLAAGFAQFVLGKKTIDEATLEELETRLLTADMGMEVTQAVLAAITERLSRQQLTDVAALWGALHDELLKLLIPVQQPLLIDKKPYVILMIGVNGVGKTTTIGKLACHFKAQGKSVLLAAGDTFRAAAVEQLQVWGTRNQIPVIAQASGADAAAVLYDAIKTAQARAIDIVIADTAGRLHTQRHLMDELKKIKRVMAKADATAPHEVMLVVDATTGQNALHQALQFHQAMSLTGITLTKLDGTAKGGILFAIAKRLAVPIRFIGVGEGIDDLQVFNSRAFVEALLAKTD